MGNPLRSTENQTRTVLPDTKTRTIPNTLKEQLQGCFRRSFSLNDPWITTILFQ